MHARVGRCSELKAHVPIVLVHGLGISSLYMVPLARQLAGRYDVYAPDLPGFGRSDKPDRVPDLTALADTLLHWMDSAGLQQVDMVGNSMGCQVITELVMQSPEHLRRAVFVGPTVDPDARTRLAQVRRGAIDAFREPVPLLLDCAYDYLRAGPLRLAHTLDILVQDPVADKLPHVSAPVLVVRGSRDPIVPRAWAEEAARLLPNGVYAEVRGSAHAAHYSAPERVAALVRAFFG